MSKEERRKKNLRLVLKRGSVFAAAIASVAVGQGVAHADAVQPTDATSPVVSTSSESSDLSTTSEKVTEVAPTTENSEPMTTEVPKTEESVTSESPVTSEEPKTEEPKIEEPKTEEPKTEEPTPIPTPSPEEPTPTPEEPTPTPEEPTPSPEEPKPEEPVPTPEEPTPTPTPEEPKPEEPKPEEPTPSPEEPTPTPEEPKPEEPKPEEPKPEEPKPEEPKPEEPNVSEPKVKFKDKDKVSTEGNNYNLSSSGLTEVEVELPSSVTPSEKDSIIQTTPNGVEKRIQGTSGYVLPVDSTLEYSHVDEKGEETRTLLGFVVDKEKYDTSVSSTDNKVDLSVPNLLDGDKLPEVMYLVSVDGTHTLTAKQVDGVYHFDSSELPTGSYEFKLANNTVTYYGRKFKSQTITLKGKPEVPVIEVPTKPSDSNTSDNTTKPSEPTQPAQPTEPTQPAQPTEPTQPVRPIVPETPSVPEKPVAPLPPTTDQTGGAGGTIINPQPQDHNNTGGNTNTGDNINIGGVSNQTNYIENPNKLTVGVSDGSVREVKATVSSQDGTSELSGRVVNGAFVADSLPDKDGVYTVKVQVTDDKGQTSEKTITYAVNKNGSTYDWLNKDVNGAYYQYLSEDLKLSEHSTTRLDTSKTKFTFTLDGKVVTVDSSLVKVEEKKEEDGSYTYTYTFNKDGFKDNGVWSISVATVDVDGHASSSNASVQFQFVLDNIVPELKVEGILNNGKYNTAKHQFKVLVKDNIGLARVRVLINGKVYEFTKEELLKGEKILDLERSETPYSIEVEVVDLAGNVTTQKVEGITVSATTLDALLQSDNFKLILGVLGVGFLGSLLAWWFAAVRKRKRKEQVMEELRVGAHLLTEAEGLASSSGVSTADAPNPNEPNLDETSELGGAGFAASEVLESIKDSAKTEVPKTGDVSELGDTTSTLPLEDSEKLSTLDVDPETAILDSEATGVVSDEETSVLDSDEEGEEATSVLDADEETSVLESDEEVTSVLDSEEETSVLSSEDETTSVLDEGESTSVLGAEEEVTSVLDSEENTGKTDILEPSEDTDSLSESQSKAKKPKSKGSRKSTKKSK